MKKMLVLGSFLIGVSAFAHNPFMNCFDNGDETISCEAGFSDGSSGAGNKFRVQQNGKFIVDGKLTADSEFTFKKPKGEFTAIFDAGKGHIVKVPSNKIAK